MAVVKAEAKYIRVSPFKARIVMDQIRGKSYEEANQILTFSPKGAAFYIRKVLNSAAANAENNLKDEHLNRGDLVVEQAYVDEGPTIKRYQYRAMGRVNRIRKRTSHITIGLSEKRRNSGSKG